MIRAVGPQLGRWCSPTAGLLLVVALLAPACDSGGPREAKPQPPDPSPARVEFDPAGDERFAVLWSKRGCPPFLGDTSDLAPVLAHRLLDGSRDTLRWVRGELMQGGPECASELERLLAESLVVPAHATRAVAILEVLGSMPGGVGRAGAKRALRHRSDSVRIAALAVLRNHPSQADWDDIQNLLPGASDDLRQHARATLKACDSRRAAFEALAEVRAGIGDEGLCAGMSFKDDAELAAQAREALSVAPLGVAVHLLAGLAATGDEDARTRLSAILRDESVSVRQSAAAACVEAGLRDLLLASGGDEDGSIRLLCVKQLADGKVAGSRALLRDRLDDLEAEPRAAALEALVLLGDLQAIDRAVAMLGGSQEDRNIALRALRTILERDAELRTRVLQRLLELRPSIAGPGRREIDRALALVPDPRAAALLAGAARGDADIVQGRSSHRWYCDLLGGMGAVGLERLVAMRSDEADLARRIDLAWAMSFGRDEPARRALQGVLDDAAAHPAEKLLAADLLVRLGPASDVAPRLKRVAMSIHDPAWRGAFNCLLWDSYAK